MKLSKIQLNNILIPKWLPIFLLIIALIGFGDSTYLTFEHFQNEIPPCTIGGCESVLTSTYSEFIGIPVAIFGAIYYLFMMIMLFLYIDLKKEIYIRIPVLISIIGLLASLWFSFLQLFIIKAFCPYCVVSGITSLIIFITSVYIVLCYNLKEKTNEKEPYTLSEK